MSKTINISVNSESKIIQFDGFKATGFQINYTDDINFTELISELTDIIDTGEVIELNVEDFDDSDGKLKIVMETINSIFEKYSESLAITDQSEDTEDLPF